MVNLQTVHTVSLGSVAGEILICYTQPDWVLEII